MEIRPHGRKMPLSYVTRLIRKDRISYIRKAVQHCDGWMNRMLRYRSHKSKQGDIETNGGEGQSLVGEMAFPSPRSMINDFRYVTKIHIKVS